MLEAIVSTAGLPARTPQTISADSVAHFTLCSASIQHVSYHRIHLSNVSTRVGYLFVSPRLCCLSNRCGQASAVHRTKAVAVDRNAAAARVVVASGRGAAIATTRRMRRSSMRRSTGSWNKTAAGEAGSG